LIIKVFSIGYDTFFFINKIKYKRISIIIGMDVLYNYSQVYNH